MGLGLGALVDDSAGGVDGLPYLQFVVPGILAMQAMMTAFGESTYAVMGYIKWNQMYAAMLATPLRVVEVLGGHLAVVAFHLFTGARDLRGRRGAVRRRSPRGGWCWPCRSAVLTGLAFAVPTFALAARLENDNGFSILFRFVVTPLMLFSGTFFPIDQLPAWMQPLAWVTPLWHGVELLPRRLHRHRARRARAGAPGACSCSTSASAGCSPARSFTRRLVS